MNKLLDGLFESSARQITGLIVGDEKAHAHQLYPWAKAGLESSASLTGRSWMPTVLILRRRYRIHQFNPGTEVPEGAGRD